MMKYYIALAFSILTQCTGLIFLKKGMVAKYAYGSLNRIGAWLGLFTNIYVLLGVFFFVVSLILWMFILIKIVSNYSKNASNCPVMCCKPEKRFKNIINISGYIWNSMDILDKGVRNFMKISHEAPSCGNIWNKRGAPNSFN